MPWWADLLICIPILGFLFRCLCCSFTCLQFQDLFTRADSTSLGADWTEVAGDSQILSNALAFVGVPNGIAICNSTLAPELYITVNFASGTSGDQGRILFDYVDSSNYWFVEFQYGSPGYLSLYQRASGSDTLIGTRSLTFTGGFRIFICLSAFAIKVSSNITGFGNGGYIQTYATPSGTGIVGLGTGATCAGTVSFLDFKAEWHDNNTCQTCISCPWCSEGYFPGLEFQVTLSGVSAGVCVNCANYNATFIGQHDWFFCGGDAGLSFCGANRLLAEIDKPGSDYIVRVTAQDSSTPIDRMIFEKNVGSSAPTCTGFSDTLSHVSSDSQCNGAAATCTVTIL